MDSSTAITSADFSGVIDAVTGQISVGTVVEILAYTVGISIGLVFAWWGIRKGIAMLMAAFRRGRLSA